MLDVPHLSYGGHAPAQELPDFTRRQPDQGVSRLPSHHLSRQPSSPHKLSTLTRLKLQIVDRNPRGNPPQRQAISNLRLSGLAGDNTINMVVFPNVLNIESNGEYIHVHTDISYDSAAVANLEVKGTTIEDIYTFADSCGNLVVKCAIDPVKTIVSDDDEAVFTLIYNYNGEIYSGTDTIDVIRVIPQKP